MTLNARYTVLATALLLLTLAHANADEKKPVIASDSKIIEASVTIDPALKAYPKLYDRLLAAGKKDYDKALAEAAKDFKEEPDMLADGRKYSFARGDEMLSAIGPYVSIVRSDDTYEGGAHPNHLIDTLLWDTRSERFVNIKPLFKEMADGGPTLKLISRLLRRALAEEKKSRGIEVKNADTDEGLKSVTAKITAIGGIALAPSTEKDKSAGLIAYFSPYAVGPYAEGEYDVFVPYTAFQAALSDGGKALFGGTRPATDSRP